MAAALLVRYRASGNGTRLRYWKPIQTGIEQDDDTKTVCDLASCRDDEVLDQGVRLEHPVSPHVAARLNAHPIETESLVSTITSQPDSDRWIVEGAGGILVPIDESSYMVDFIRTLGLPAVVVARASLGTINHTLLTLEALRARSIPVAGVVMSGEPNQENRRAIEMFGLVPVLGEVPPLNPVTPAALTQWAEHSLDRDARLANLLT